MQKPPLISLIFPVYNEADNLQLLYERISEVLAGKPVHYEIVFVDDGSQDRSLEIIKELAQKQPDVRYISFSRNFGHQIALTAGIDAASGDAAIFMDADLQDPPGVVWQLIEKWQEGFEVVYAKRKKREGETLFKKWTAALFYRIMGKMTAVPIPLDTGDFRIVDRKVLDALKAMPEQQKFLRGQISWIGFNQTYVEFERAKRHAGETGYSLGKMIKFALDGITSFSDLPLKFATWAGFVVSGLAFIAILWALASRFIFDNYVQGWTSLMISVLFLGGIQLICLGILGEYISRLGNNVRKRPLYIIRESNFNKEKEV